MSDNPARTRAAFWEEGPFCWNCELSDTHRLDPDIPVYFCEEEFKSHQPLNNFLAKRAVKLRRWFPGRRL